MTASCLSPSVDGDGGVVKKQAQAEDPVALHLPRNLVLVHLQVRRPRLCPGGSAVAPPTAEGNIGLECG